MPVYNKLVRYGIPEIIDKSGKKALTRVLKREEYIIELRKKFKEEWEEYIKAKSDTEAIEELADLMEIIHSITELHKSSFEEIDKVRKKKLSDRGSFAKKVFLIEVE